MYQKLTTGLHSARDRFLLVAGVAIMMAACGSASAATIDPATAQLQLQPLQVQDAHLLLCQQRYAENLGQCVSGPICYGDNGICNYPPADPSCADQALAKYQRCVARGPRLTIIN